MMSDDQTVQLSTYFPLTVRAEEGVLQPGDCRFTHSFRIGRAEECEVQCVDRSVSRIHIDVLFESGQWWVQDHQSRNGTFVDGQKIDRLCLTGFCNVKLGKDGPMLSLQVDNLLDNAALATPRTTPEVTSFPNSSSIFSSDKGVVESSVSPDDSDQKLSNFEEGVRAKEQGNLPDFVDSEKDLPELFPSEKQPPFASQENSNQSIQDSNPQPPTPPGRIPAQDISKNLGS